MQKLLIYAAIVTVVIFAGSLIVHRKPHTTAPDTRSRLVILTNAYMFSPQINTNDLHSVQTALYGQVKVYRQHPASYYSATIRQGSVESGFSQHGGSTSSAKVPSVSYIVDIPVAQLSFVVSEDGGPNYSYDIVHIICPLANELRYGDFGCKNADQ